MKSYCVLIFLCGFSLFSFAQKKENFKSRSVCFIIKVHRYHSEKAADSLASIHEQQMEEFESGKNLFPPPPPRVSIIPLDINGEDYMFVSSKKILRYPKPRPELGEEKKEFVDVRSLYYININRDSLTEQRASLISGFGRYNKNTPIKYWEPERFPIISENKNIVRKINGFNCYQVIVKDRLRGTGHIIEMLVTEWIFW